MKTLQRPPPWARLGRGLEREAPCGRWDQLHTRRLGTQHPERHLHGLQSRGGDDQRLRFGG